MNTTGAARTPVRLMVFKGLQNLPILAGVANRFFEKRGLALEISFAPHSEALRSGLAAGRFDIVHTAVDNAIAMAETIGADIVVLCGGDDGFNSLIVQPDIRSPADMRDRTVAVDATNTAFALMLYKILKQHGLGHGTYRLRPAGATPFRLQALLDDRSLAGAMLNLPFSLQAERVGLKNLGLGTDMVGPYLSGSGFAMRAWAKANADTVVRYLQGYIEGLRWALLPANREASIDMLERELRLSGDVAASCYDRAADPKNGLARDARLDLAGLQNVLAIRAEMEGQWGGEAPAPERYLDLSYHERALRTL